MPGLVPGIPLRWARPRQWYRDGRNKSGHDGRVDERPYFPTKFPRRKRSAMMIERFCNKRVWEMNIRAADFKHGEAIDHDILHADIPDAALEVAANAGVAGGAMSFPNAPTVSILVVCCSFDGSS